MDGIRTCSLRLVLAPARDRLRRDSGRAPELVGGLVCLVVSVILLSPLFLAAMARAAKAAPIAARLALRDLLSDQLELLRDG